MTTKRKGLLLVLIYILLIALALPLHAQKGVAWNESFYVQKAENHYSADKNNHFTYTHSDDSILFDLTVNGYACRAVLTQPQENTYQFTFDDGFTVVLSGAPLGALLVNNQYLSLGDNSVTVIDDLSQTPLTFAPYVTKEAPFYDGETGSKQIGRWITYETENGKHLYGYEIWDDGSYPAYLPTFVTLADGAVIDRSRLYDGSVLYLNDQNEVLTNTELLSYFPYEYAEDRVDRQSYCWLLVNTAVHERVESRGHAIAFFASLLYFLGAAQFLWPEQMAFLGSRWQYRYEPELSDAGLAMTKFSAVFIMLISILPLFLPLFIH
ncbi:MAG: hypothetical protein II343_04885 [Clostridia bacterium]|nr:hypothetical protein [Clostridia bacterium]